jgi:nitrogen regulatory protein PII 2
MSAELDGIERGRLKEVIAVIRMKKMQDTKRALTQAGFGAFTVRHVTGRGRGLVDFRLLQLAENNEPEVLPMLAQGPRLIPKRMLSIVVTEDRLQLLVQTLISANQTGKPGDGKIFVLPVENAIRVRTHERGPASLSDDWSEHPSAVTR